MNWISMYAQSDVQRNRQFYVGDGFYEDFDTDFDQSPLEVHNKCEDTDDDPCCRSWTSGSKPAVGRASWH